MRLGSGPLGRGYWEEFEARNVTSLGSRAAPMPGSDPRRPAAPSCRCRGVAGRSGASGGQRPGPRGRSPRGASTRTTGLCSRRRAVSRCRGRWSTSTIGCRRSSGSQIRLHDLRHTSVTLMLGAGIPVHVVAAVHGHDPVITQRIYAHTHTTEAMKAMAALDDLIRPAPR